MSNFIKKSLTLTVSLITISFTLIPESMFGKYKLISNVSDGKNILLNRLLICIFVFSISSLYLHYRKKIILKGHNYIIDIEYGDLFKMHDCKKVIDFDECFTTSVGNEPSEIKPGSICGQYLEKNPIQDIQSLIDKAKLKPSKTNSKYENKERYESGKLIPNGDYLLMAFAKLDKDGLGIMSRDEFIDCLSVLWQEIDKYYGQEDVCIPILGSGLTRMNGDGSLFKKQELLDMIIYSYKLSSHKIKSPNKLHIVCKKCKDDDFSLNKIGTSI
ncbi:macro domain-containing protein [Clostridium novyi]|uniref:macro domain-containing protein n=1 Tax=Clostridium novyi TaxID=1542 RepID=UPI0004D787A9|nr:hypothetical protein Z964_09165 [Clostridium novyi A str. GD211209]